MQLGSKEEEAERFNHYMKKTYKKSASLIANSCKAVSSFCHFVVDCLQVSSDHVQKQTEDVII